MYMSTCLHAYAGMHTYIPAYAYLRAAYVCAYMHGYFHARIQAYTLLLVHFERVVEHAVFSFVLIIQHTKTT